MNTILSLRKCNSQFYNTVMYEWEDDLVQKGFVLEMRSEFAKKMGLLIQKIIKSPYRIRQTISMSGSYGGGKKTHNRLVFLMFVSQYREYYPNKVIPIFIDTRVDSFEVLIEGIKDIDLAIITNRSAWEKAKQIYPEKKLYSIPLWCSGKWILDTPPTKTVDVLQIGRKNDILHSFMLRFVSTHPKVEYVYREDCSNDYISTIRGNIGSLETREDYMAALRKARVCLVSSPLVDSAPEMDFITPRVYESAMSYCYMLGRFTRNAEFKEVGLDRVVDIIEDYETFESRLTGCIESKDFIRKADFDHFISDNSFDARYKELSRILDL
ncbi:hypothetical protein F040043B6_21010 [Bacteroides uniformis]|jgi:hypothetical protein|uniref:hypothetical protein n=1 Tax=Bacteroidaceae TaxID=815 RepID=UPI0034B803D3